MPKQQKQFQKHIHCITKFLPIAKIDHRYYTVKVGNRSSFCRNIYLLVNHHSIHKKIICNECITEFRPNNNKEKLYRPISH